MLRRTFTIAASLACSGSFALTIGDKAPPLKVGTFVKGAKVDLSKGVHVVEFWATWCGPCKQTIPHLTEMAKRYRGKVSFTGVSVYENGSDQIGQVRKFVASMGDKMAYNVAWDGEAKAMAKTWMEASKQSGIPASFLVKNGRILWIGHPLGGLDKAIDQTLAGTYDLAAAKAALGKQRTPTAAEQKAALVGMLPEAVQPAFQFILDNRLKEALKALDGVSDDSPDCKKIVSMLRFSVLVSLGDPRQKEEAQAILDSEFAKDPSVLSRLAESILDPKAMLPNPDYGTALLLAKAAADRSEMKDPFVLDVYAAALAMNGKKPEAIDVLTKALKLAKADAKVDPTFLEKMESRLKEYQKAP